MEKKRYRSYDEIDRDLQILQVERELHYQKMKRGVDRVTEELKVGNLIEGYLGFSSRDPVSLTGRVVKWILPLALKWMKGTNREKAD